MYKNRSKSSANTWRISVIRWFFVVFAIIIIVRLFTLQIINFQFYDALASGQYSFYEELFAERGSVLVKDWNDSTEYLAATNEPRGFIFAEPRKIEDPIETAKKISLVLGYEITDELEALDELEVAGEGEEDQIVDIMAGLEEQPSSQVTAEAEGVIEQGSEEVITEVIEDEPEDPYANYRKLVERFSKEDDPYEPVARGVDQATLEKIDKLDLPGIHYLLEDNRAYPEIGLGGQVFGFVRKDDELGITGQYGLEGYFNDFLAGTNGFLDAETDVAGRWIGVGSRDFQPAIDGGDILLTIDRTVQYMACKMLREGVERYDADGGSLVISHPATGRIIAICNVPDFDPNVYNEVEDIAVYNNNAIFTPYEPGSVFKPLTMAAALDTGAVTPSTLYNDLGEEDVDDYTIRNSDLKANGIQSMTSVLELSLNTGMIFVMRQMGQDVLRDYVHRFGFGRTSGIELNSEAAGNIRSLDKTSEIYFATASYGQGITVTALQLNVAYAALANSGTLMKPFIVEERRYPNGTVEETMPKTVQQVISRKTATTIGAMMVSVIENGHASKAAVPGYYMAGKTGTAQVARENGLGYQANFTKATFSGFGPVKDPIFAMTVMIDRPRTIPWAADTAAPVFGEIAEFLMQYYEVAPTRLVE